MESRSVTLRIPADLVRRCEREARSCGLTRSRWMVERLAEVFGNDAEDLLRVERKPNRRRDGQGAPLFVLVPLAALAAGLATLVCG